MSHESHATQDLVEQAQNSVNGRQHVLEKLTDTLQGAQAREKATINDLQGAVRGVDECERSIAMAASRIKQAKERKADLDAEVDRAVAAGDDGDGDGDGDDADVRGCGCGSGADACAAAAAESELLAHENDCGSLLRLHQQRLQQAKNEIAVHRRQQVRLRAIPAA